MTFPDTYQPQSDPVPGTPGFDLATAKLRLGITDDAQDAAIQYALDMAMQVAELYCDRAFTYKAETVRYVDNRWPRLLVRRWPIEAVTACVLTYPSGAGTQIQELDVEDLAVNHEYGTVSLQGVWGPSVWGAHGYRATVELSYTGGYKTLPSDLQQALWTIFDEVWARTPGMGAPAGETSTGGGAVRQFAIDGMSLAFDTGASDSAASRAGGDIGAWGPFLPLGATTLLQRYRAETVMGAA